MQTKFRYDIQGLRALAVLSVLLTHTFPQWLTGGFVGVDIFFVISGYLISKILFKECSQNNFSIANFYKRRVKRIFPALIFVVVTTLIIAYFILSPTAFRETSRNVFSTMLFASNIDYWKSTSYFANAAELKPLLHTWSLSVEEQFYIFFPILIFYLYKISNRKLTEYILWGLLLTSLVISEVVIQIDPSAAYYFFPTRAFELMLGAIVAYKELFSTTKKVNNIFIIGLGFILTILPILMFSSATRFPGISALIPTIGTALLITVGSLNSHYKGSTLLTAKWMVYIGNISFSLYLWHWPILAFIRNLYTVDLTLTQSVVAILLSFLMAALSYEYVEKPFLKNSTINYLKFGLFSIVALSAMSLTIYLKQGFPSRFSNQSIEIFKASSDFNPLRAKCHYDGKNPPAKYENNCVIGDPNVEPSIAVWGDSHGAELAYVLGDAGRFKSKSILEITSSSCPPAVGYEAKGRRFCTSHNQTTLSGLMHDPRISTVIMVSNYIRYDDFEQLESGLKRSINQLLSANKFVVLVSQTPLMTFDPPAKLGLANQRNERLELIGLDSNEFKDEINKTLPLMNSFLGQQKVLVFNPQNKLCDPSICKVYDPIYGVLYFNDNHLSLAGAKYAFKPLIEQLLK